MKLFPFLLITFSIINFATPSLSRAAICTSRQECVDDFADGNFDLDGCILNATSGVVECDPGDPGSSDTGTDYDAFCGGDVNQGINTAIGCLMAQDPTAFIGQILGWAVIVGGGIAFLLIAFAGFQISTAAGDPKRVQSARELLTAAVSGLLLIIFSIFLLNFIGIKILNLTSLGFPLPAP